MTKQSINRVAKTKEDLRGKIKSDFPKHTVTEALRVARALADKNGGQPLPPTETAIAMGLSPGSSELRVLLSSSIKYGLTSGSYNSERVSLEEPGRNIIEPRSSEDERRALVSAALTPPTFRAIYDYFRGKKLPDETFFINTLVREFQVPREHGTKCVQVFTKNMEQAALIHATNTGKWLSTDTAGIAPATVTVPSNQLNGDAEDESPAEAPLTPAPELKAAPAARGDKRLNRVFITHGKNTAFITPLKDLLSFGQLEAVVCTERESVAQPVPDKVMNDMRSCGAAIIHVEDEQKLVDAEAHPQIIVNSNVLIEIGAAMALYGRRFILLVKDGVQLPSNLQGLYEVRFSGEKLDGEVTIKLLRAINEIKNHPLPTT
jgi:predicted nucleotide-binding protein